MKVITEKGDLKAKTVNDKAAIEHGIAQKTELSKKSGGGLEKQQVRIVGGTEKAAKADTPKSKPPVAAQKREHFAKGKSAKTNSNVAHEKPQLAETSHATHPTNAAKSDLADKSTKAENSIKASGANAVKSADISTANSLRQSTDKPLVSANGSDIVNIP